MRRCQGGPSVAWVRRGIAVLMIGAFLPFPSVAEDVAAAPKIPNARTPGERILTGGQPTPEQVRELAAAGYRTIVNLRAPGEEGGWDEAPLAEELGLRYVSIPMAGVEALTEQNARRLAGILEDEDAYPMLIHCRSGNRVGALFALQAFYLDGRDPDAAVEIGLEAGLTSLETAVREHLATAASR